MTQVDDGNSVAQVILAADKLEQARNGTFDNGRLVANDLLKTMTKMESPQTSAPVLFLLAENIIEAIHGGITLRSNCSNQLEYINSEQDYYLSKIVYLCIRWASTEELGQERSKKLIVKIVEVIKAWNKRFPRQPEIATFVPWRKHANSVGFVAAAQLSLPEHGQSIFIQLTPQRRLRHATSTINAFEILSGIRNQQITFNNSCSSPGTTPNLVWCGVVVEEEEIRDIPERAKGYVNDNRFGAVIFEFPIESTSRVSGKVGYVLGTKKYVYEYSQAILIPESSSPSPPNDMQFVIINEAGDQIIPLEMVHINNFNWELSYSSGGPWTHPELAFATELKVPVSEIKISFVVHNCPTQKKCYDCKKGIREEEDVKKEFKRLMKDFTEQIKSTLGSAFTSEDYVAMFGSQEM